MKRLTFILCFLIIAGLGVRAFSAVSAVAIKQEATVSVNIGINYGSGPVEWHNGTVVSSGESLLNATRNVATVETTTFAGLGEFVTGINGRNQDPAAGLYWTFWLYNPQTHEYELPPVGAGAYLLTSDQTFQWYYSSGMLAPGASVSLNAHLDTSTDPPTAVISGSIRPSPGSPVNVTLEYSQNQGANYQQIAKIMSAPDGSFSYSWRLPGGGVFLIRADALGVKSIPVSVGVSSGIPGFPVESIAIGAVLGLLIGVLARKRRTQSRIVVLDSV